MKKALPLFFLFTVSFLFSYSQNSLVKQWDKRFGGTSDDQLYSIQQTTDGGYILGGFSYSGISGDKTQASRGSYDYWIVKTDYLGIKQWDKRFGGSNNDYLKSLQQTIDGGYILGGYSNSGISGDKTQGIWGWNDYWVVKIDSLGNKQWDKDFGGTVDDYLFSLRQTSDGGYILGGCSNSDSSGDKTQLSRGGNDYWIVKIDSLGNKQWDKGFGGTSNDQLYCIQQTIDGGYVLGGYSYSGISGDKTQASWGQTDYWILKIDSAGTKQWDKRFGGTDYDFLFSLQQSIDGGYILGGTSYSNISGDKSQTCWGNNDYWIIKIDSLGNKQWDKDFGGTSGEDEFSTITQTLDKGYLIAGTSYSPISGNKTENNLGHEQTWIVKMDSLGNKKWDKTLRTNTPADDELGFAIQTKNGCYVFANSTLAGIGGDKTQANWDNNNQTQDFWIIKFCDSTMAALPHSDFISSDTSFCAEPAKCINFYDHSTGNPTSWQWSFPGGTPSFSNLQNPDSICYYNAGTYPVTLIVTNSSGSDTLTVSPMIIVGGTPQAPTVTVVGLDTLISSHAVSYQWYYNGSVISGATDSFYVAQQWGTYAVMITDSNGCSRLSGGVAVGVDEISGGGGIEVYPNPVDKELTVYGLRFTVGETMEIYNVLGKKVKTEKLSANGATIVDVRDLVAGVYFLSVWSERGRFVGKFVKE